MQVETNVVQYASSSSNLALFETAGKFWVGVFMPSLVQYRGQVPYAMTGGYFSTQEDGMHLLDLMSN